MVTLQTALQTAFLNAITGTEFDATHDQSVKPVFNVLTLHFTSAPETVVDAALAAFLPHSSKHHPLLERTFKEIEAVWPYVKKKFTDEPIWLDRYVLGMALLNLADQDHDAAARMYLVLKDPFSYTAETTESEFRTSLLQTWQPRFNKLSQRFWQPAKNFTPALAKMSAVELPTASLSRLKEALSDAIGGPAFQDAAANKYTLVSSWSDTFTATTGTAIIASINEGLKELTQKLPAQLRTANAYHELIQEILDTATRAKRQGQLMWWLQSKYSVTKDLSYRTLDPLNGALQMTLDFAQFELTLAPSEVDAVLLEALWTTYPEAMKVERTLNDWINEVIACPEAAGFGTPGKTTTPLLLCDVIAIKRRGGQADAAALVGVDPKAKLTLANLTLWLWHSAQVSAS